MKKFLIISIIIFGIICGLYQVFNKPYTKTQETQEKERQELLNEQLKFEKCLKNNREEYLRLWNEDCKALGRENNCSLTLGLTLIIEKKIGCKK